MDLVSLKKSDLNLDFFQGSSVESEKHAPPEEACTLCLLTYGGPRHSLLYTTG